MPANAGAADWDSPLDAPKVTSSATTDFSIDDLDFEVGGRNKGQKQIKTVENGYVVKDDIENGYLNTIPLWHFGLMY